MGTINFESRPFAEGASRYAYKGRVVEGSYAGYPKGTDVVVKVIKPKYFKKGIRITRVDIDVQRITQRYAKKFNSTTSTSKHVYVLVGAIQTCSSDKFTSGGRRYIAKGQSMLVERLIHGQYEKFNSNGGWSSGEHNTPDAFSHWTWVQSNGAHLCCDLQGHRGRPGGPKHNGKTEYYLLTDPVVMSKAQRYGNTDLGQAGILDWFACHQCNEFCRSLGIHRNRPKPGLRARAGGAVSTSYRYR